MADIEQTRELPPLPKPEHMERGTGMGPHDVYYRAVAYTAQQMRDYALAAAASQPQAPAAAMLTVNERIASHYCNVCGALWAESEDCWSLVSLQCGKCCDNAPMGEQISRISSAPVHGWVVADGQETRWRKWGDSGPEWTSDRNAALHFARRVDAEAFSRDDEDAWLIRSVSPTVQPAVPGGFASVPTHITDDMTVAFAETWFSKKRPIDDVQMEDCYAAMLAAAPLPEVR